MTLRPASLASGAGVIAFAACAMRAPPALWTRDDTRLLVAPSAYGVDFLDRQNIVATYGDRSFRFDAVLQKRGDELTLLGLTPFGSRAFVVRQTGTDVFFESFVSPTLPFPPRYILVDVQRVFYGLTRDDDAAVAAFDIGRGDEVVTERWRGGRLWRRAFRRRDGKPPGEIVVEYDGGMARDGIPPAHVALTNGWYGYRLDIKTVSHERL